MKDVHTYKSSSYLATLATLDDGTRIAFFAGDHLVPLAAEGKTFPCPVIPPGRSVDGALADHALAMGETVDVPAADLVAAFTGETDDLLGTTEIAQLLGWQRQRVHDYVRLGRLPEPVARLAMGPVFRRSDVERVAREKNWLS